MQFNEDAFQFEISSNESEGQCANIAYILDARETSQSEKIIDSNDEQLLNILDMPVIWEAPQLDGSRGLSEEQPPNTLDMQIAWEMFRFFRSIDLAGSPSDNPLISSDATTPA